MGKSFGIVSLKGGVGKTSVVISLGSAIASFGKKVLLVDGDLSSGNLGMHFKIMNPSATLHHVLRRELNAKDAVHHVENFDVVPVSISNKEAVNPLKLRDRIKSLRRKYDIIIIDSSPSLGEETLATMLASDSIFVVATPDCPTLSATIKSINASRKAGAPISGLIINKAYNKNFEIPIKDIEETTGVPVMAVIPYDVNMLRALFNFKSLPEYKPNSKAVSEIKKLAGVMIGEKYKSFSLRNIFNFAPKQEEINREIFYEEMFGD